MNRRQAKREVCHWAAEVLADAPKPTGASAEDRERLTDAVNALIEELHRRGPAQAVTQTFEDVRLFALAEL